MPLTPLHLGGGLLLGVLTIKFFNLWAVLLASVIMDIEPLVLLLINPCYSCPHHGFFHSILGAIFGSLILAAILYNQKERLNKISLKYKIRQSFSFWILFFSSFLGWLFHIFFDSLTHFDVFPFWPLTFNPIFIGKEIYWPLNLILLIFGIVGLILIIKKRKTYA
jgi:membrane-bound metal-dependent hydrolase YbcI (DUF457 family)